MTSELRLWSLRDRREVRVIPGPQFPGYAGVGTSLQFVNGTNLVLVGRDQSGVQLWGLASNTPARRFEGPLRGIASAVMAPDQQTVQALSGSDVTLATRTYPQGQAMSTFSERWMQGYRYVSLTRDGKARTWWESDTGEPWPESRPTPSTSDPGSLDQAVHLSRWAADGDVWHLRQSRECLVVAFVGYRERKTALARSRLDLPMTYSFRPAPTCAALAFSPDSQALAFGRRVGR